MGHAMAAQPEGGAGLGGGGNFKGVFAEKGGDVYRSSQCGQRKLDRDLAKEVVLVPL